MYNLAVWEHRDNMDKPSKEDKWATWQGRSTPSRQAWGDGSSGEGEEEEKGQEGGQGDGEKESPGIRGNNVLGDSTV